MQKRYIVEFFLENETTNMSTIFVEATSSEDARERVVNRYGAFINIVSCNLTKSSGGAGASTDGNESTTVETTAEVVEPKRVRKTKETTPKAEKPSKAPVIKEKKVTNASRLREQIAILKSAGGTEADAAKWAEENLGQNKGTAKAYAKVLWAE